MLNRLLKAALLAMPAAAANNTWPSQKYKSSSAVAPYMEISKHGETQPGHLFISQFGLAAPKSALNIMTDAGELIWESPTADYSAFSRQTLFGEPVLVYFNGVTLPEPWGSGLGIVQILDSSYKSIYNMSITAEQENLVTIDGIDPKELFSYIDMHEAKITPDNTMLVTLYNVTAHDLTRFGGPKEGWLTTAIFYEMDVATNTILHRWRALDHLDELQYNYENPCHPIGETGKNKTVPFDFFHINSVDKFEDGSYLISSRHTCGIYRIAKDGSVEWVLHGAGESKDFERASNLNFAFQHDARIHQEAGDKLSISLFNNDNSEIVYGKNETTGIYLTLDTAAKTAVLDLELRDPADPIHAFAMGNTEKLDEGHWLMGYGSTGKIKEFDAQGKTVFTATFGPGDGHIMSYRAHRSPWVGKPDTVPDAFACFDGSKTNVYMSWNGATEHTSWTVRASVSDKRLKTAKKVQREGKFETAVAIDGKQLFVEVEAIGKGLCTKSAIISVAASC